MAKKKSVRRSSSHRTSSKKQHILVRLISIIIPVVLVVIGIQTVFPKLFKHEAFCANSISCINDLTGNFEPNQKKAVFHGKDITVPETLAMTQEPKAVLGESTADKHIYVDLSVQHLYAFENNKLVYDFPVSTGKWAQTPTGNFKIWVKLRYTRMSGGNPAIGTYYDLPNVPYVMFFYNDQVAKSQGFSIHGTYWHDNFGHPMSHGCVNVKTEEVAKLYEWAHPETSGTLTYATDLNPGTEVTIYGQTPNE